MGKKLVNYTREQIEQAAIHYAIHGSYAKLQRDLSIPKGTAHGWTTTGNSVWLDTIEHVRTENQDKHIATYNRLTDKALEAAERGIDELAEDKLTVADIKALVVSGATTTDKGLLLQGKATSISGKSESMDAMRLEFARMSASHDKLKSQAAVLEASVIDEQ